MWKEAIMYKLEALLHNLPEGTDKITNNVQSVFRWRFEPVTQITRKKRYSLSQLTP
jgi:hypothetical protein